MTIIRCWAVTHVVAAGAAAVDAAKWEQLISVITSHMAMDI